MPIPEHSSTTASRTRLGTRWRRSLSCWSRPEIDLALRFTSTTACTAVKGTMAKPPHSKRPGSSDGSHTMRSHWSTVSRPRLASPERTTAQHRLGDRSNPSFGIGAGYHGVGHEPRHHAVVLQRVHESLGIGVPVIIPSRQRIGLSYRHVPSPPFLRPTLQTRLRAWAPVSFDVALCGRAAPCAYLPSDWRAGARGQ
jgi:hypothetical protein